MRLVRPVSALALLALLQPLLGGLGVAFAKPAAKAEDPFSFIEICTAVGIQVVRFDRPDPEDGDAPPRDFSSKFCPGCLSALSFAILDPRIMSLVSFRPTSVERPSRSDQEPRSRVPSSDLKARAPPPGA